jgi:hypothetical protein
VEEVRDRGY